MAHASDVDALIEADSRELSQRKGDVRVFNSAEDASAGAEGGLGCSWEEAREETSQGCDI